MALDKAAGSRGKIKRLSDFWFRVKVAFFEKFNWLDYRESDKQSKDAVLDVLTEVSTPAM